MTTGNSKQFIYCLKFIHTHTHNNIRTQHHSTAFRVRLLRFKLDNLDTLFAHSKLLPVDCKLLWMEMNLMMMVKEKSNQLIIA